MSVAVAGSESAGHSFQGTVPVCGENMEEFRIGDHVLVLNRAPVGCSQLAVVVPNIYASLGMVAIRFDDYIYSSNDDHHSRHPGDLELIRRGRPKSFSRVNQKTLRKRMRDQMAQEALSPSPNGNKQ